MDECRVAPGQTLHVKLLSTPLFNRLHNIARPAATGCSVCGRPWTAHEDPGYQFQCEKCGATLDPACFYEYIATEAEYRWHHDPEDTDPEFIFMCAGCRQ